MASRDDFLEKLLARLLLGFVFDVTQSFCKPNLVKRHNIAICFCIFCNVSALDLPFSDNSFM